MRTAVVRVDVETGPDGSLVVNWALEGDAASVDVAVGSTPDNLDHRHQITAGADTCTVRITSPGPGRHFVSVAAQGGGPALVAGERRVPFTGVTNFRDLGGYPSRLGGRTRWGMIFRADALHGLSDDDMALYDQLGVRVVYDLRSELERAELPNPVRSLPLTILGQPQPAADPYQRLSSTAAMASADGESVLHDVYVGLIEHAAGQIGELFTGLTRDRALPALFHCHAGKDRTGVVAALLLETLGVDRDAILDDYELTARYRLRSQQEGSYQRLLEAGLTPEAAAGVLTTPRWAMQDALGHLDAQFGGIEAYLTGPAGMSPNAVEALRRLLVSPSSAVA